MKYEATTDFDDNIDLADIINQSIVNMDYLLKDIFLDDSFMKEGLPKFFSDNYNNLSAVERRELFCDVHNYVSSALGQNVLSNSLYTMNDELRPGKLVSMDRNGVYINRKVLERKNVGIVLLGNYVKETRKFLIDAILQGAYSEEDFDDNKLKGVAREYYDNSTASILKSWDNMLTLENKDYPYQPIVVDTEKFTIEITKEYIKHLFNQFKKIDTEISAIAYEHMSYENTLPEFMEKRARLVKENRERVNNAAEETKMFQRYFRTVDDDISKLSDEKFYALFNSNFVCAFDESIPDSDLRIEKVANELMNRIFAGKPNYEPNMFNWNVRINEIGFFDVVLTMPNEIVKDMMFGDVTEFFNFVGSYIPLLAQKYDLFKFKSKEEREDYEVMRAWNTITLVENRAKFDNYSSNHANIIVMKAKELIYELCNNIKSAIAKSEFVPHGKSIISYYDEKAYEDFLEYKMDTTKEEEYKRLMNNVMRDLAEHKAGGAR